MAAAAGVGHESGRWRLDSSHRKSEEKQAVLQERSARLLAVRDRTAAERSYLVVAVRVSLHAWEGKG
jgi:hypothetical protein